MKIFLIGCCCLLAFVVVGWLILTNGCADPTADIQDAGRGKAAEVPVHQNQDNDLRIVLNGENTDIKWTGSNSVGQQPTGYFYQLAGEAFVDPETRQLRQLQLKIEMDGVQSISTSLTQKLKHHGFFQVDQFPQATFVSTMIEPIDINQADPPDAANFWIHGNFQLRDVTQSIRIPAKLTATETAIQIASQFKINRRDYGVVYDNSVADKLIRDAVLIDLNIDAPWHQPTTASPAATDNLDSNLATETTTDRLVDEPLLGNYTETIQPTLVEFDMILVPGDDLGTRQPFWIGKTEVTWEEFDYWALCKKMTDKDSIREISQLLRPSAPHDLEKIYRGWGRENQPVVGVSQKAARLYCQWLSKQTGKRYRLPTSDEWDRAFEQGGGKLTETLDGDELGKIAWFSYNAVSTDEEGFDFERAMPVGSLQANRLGIHDMLGNAAEWVTGTGDEKIVRGGHFKLPPAELSGSFREAEDQSVWNKDYPQSPKSIWWYVNADYVGFRVVCETPSHQPIESPTH